MQKMNMSLYFVGRLSKYGKTQLKAALATQIQLLDQFHHIKEYEMYGLPNMSPILEVGTCFYMDSTNLPVFYIPISTKKESI